MPVVSVHAIDQLVAPLAPQFGLGARCFCSRKQDLSGTLLWSTPTLLPGPYDDPLWPSVRSFYSPLDQFRLMACLLIYFFYHIVDGWLQITSFKMIYICNNFPWYNDISESCQRPFCGPPSKRPLKWLCWIVFRNLAYNLLINIHFTLHTDVQLTSLLTYCIAANHLSNVEFLINAL